MKKLLLLPLLTLAACGADSTTTTKKPCAEISEMGTIMVGNQMRHYFAVPHFNAKSKPCWQELRGYAKSEAAPMGLSGGVHLLVFVDTMEVAPPANGILSEKFGKRIVAQELINKEAGIDEFSPDALSYGIYKEPQ